MDLEVEALLFQKPTSKQRKNFKSTLFVESSLKLNREVRIYSLLAHLIWIELEADFHVVEYNEEPRAIPIPAGDTILNQRFSFAVRRDDGAIQVILTKDEAQPSDGSIDGNQESLTLQAIRTWSQSQNIEFQYLTRHSLAGSEVKRANWRQMLKFVETAKNCRRLEEEETIELIIQKLAPIQVRRAIENLTQFDETQVIALIARNLLSGRYSAPIDRRDFDGALVIDLIKP
jgi:hypothetical protein